MCRNGQYCNTFSSKTYEKIYKYTINVKDTVLYRDKINNYSVQYSFINYNHIQYYHHKEFDFLLLFLLL